MSALRSAQTLKPKKSSKFDMDTCRICLTQSSDISKDLCATLDHNTNSPTIYEALEYVMNEKIVKIDGLPSGICGMCLGLLTIAHDLKKQYSESKEKLMKSLKNTSQDHFDGNKVGPHNGENIIENKAPGRGMEDRRLPVVELVSGNTKYSIEDIVIVDDPTTENKEVYEGFIKNLGSVISGSFANTHAGVSESSDIVRELQKSPVPENTSDADEMERLESISIEISESTDICPHCNRSFSSANYLEQHIPICELFKKLECYICKERKGSRKRLILHLKNKHSIGKDLEAYPEEKETAQCEICFKICVSKDSLRYHMLRHTGPQCPCEVCGKTFATPYYTKKHIQHVHKKETLEVCPICAKTFTFSGGLRYHMKLHDKQYKKEAVEVCPFCAKTFHYQGGLAYHIKTHTKEYDHKCSYCDKVFGSRSANKRHELTHTGVKPYGCRFCGTHFREDTHRKNHERSIHTGEQPYKCEYCGKRFVVKNKMKYHMLTHSGPSKCDRCGKGFVTNAMLSFHLRIKHGIMYEDQQIETVEASTQGSDEELEDDDFDDNVY